MSIPIPPRKLLNLKFLTMESSEKSKVIILNKDDISIKLFNEERLFPYKENLLAPELEYSSSERLAGIGICTIHLQTRKVNFSDNIYRMLGYKPGSFIPTLRLILKFVHPEDKQRLKGLAKIESGGEESSRANNPLKIITKDKNTKYVSLNNKIIDTENAQVLIISVKDVTMETMELMKLREQNKELRRVNAQLSAFNLVASHDLQEPLRKIQVFSSRIQSDLSPHKLTDYTYKIKNTANKMQQLVNDLIAYSETSKSDITFEKINLNKVLESVLKEIAFFIEEKKAVIKIGELSEASVIPFQIHQLFVNILSNSLKYSFQEVPPEIIISQEEINASDLEKLPQYNKNELIKISIEDNGIGFEPSEAENIFVVFKRLHGKLEFDGTGIGLAICKNIIDNHNGHIMAEGKPGSGAKITFIIPKNRS